MWRANFVGTKFGGGGKRGRAKIHSPQPFFFTSPSVQFDARSARQFFAKKQAKKSSVPPKAGLRIRLENQAKQSGRRFAPPTKKSVNFPKVRFWWAMRDLNPRPFRCKRIALPTELIAHFI